MQIKLAPSKLWDVIRLGLYTKKISFTIDDIAYNQDFGQALLWWDSCQGWSENWESEK